MWQRSIFATLLILTPLTVSISLSMDIYVPSLPLITRVLHTDQSTVQWTLSLYMLGVGIGQLLFGPLSDYVGRRKVVLTGLLIYLVGTALCISAQTITTLIWARLLQSIGTCTALVVAFAVVRDVYDIKEGAKLYSFLNAATAVAPIAAPLLGGYLQIWFDTWRASFVFLACFGIASFISTAVFLQETLHPEFRQTNPKTLLKNYKRLLTHPRFLQNSFYTVICITALFIFCCISSYIVIDALHGSQQLYGMIFGSNAVMVVIANLTSPRATYYLGFQKTIRLGLFIIALGGASMACIEIYWGLSILGFILPMLLMSFGIGMLIGPASANAMADFADMAGSAAAMLSSLQFTLSGLLGTLLMMEPAHSDRHFALLMLGLSSIALIIHAFSKTQPHEITSS